MDKFYNETYLKLETAIQELEIETHCPIKRIEAVIALIIQSLADLKGLVLNHDFKNMEEEIHFFKYQKPVIVSKLIYYNAIYKIETRSPYGNKRIKKYFIKELKKLKRFFENNIDLRDFYHTYLELKSWKINQTKFLDSLRDTLIRKRDGQDER